MHLTKCFFDSINSIMDEPNISNLGFSENAFFDTSILFEKEISSVSNLQIKSYLHIVKPRFIIRNYINLYHQCFFFGKP